MSHLLPRRTVISFDPLTEHLKNLQPEQVDALEMMRGVYSTQVALASAITSLQRNAFISDNQLHDLANSVAANSLPRLTAISTEIKEILKNG